MIKDNTIKLALEALEESKTNNDSMEFHDRKNKAITVLREAQAEQPELWKPEDHYQDGWRDALQSVQKTLAQQPAQQLVDCHATGVCVQSGLRAEQPAQRTWVGLTDEDRAQCVQATVESGEALQLMSCIEAKLKEKNT